MEIPGDLKDLYKHWEKHTKKPELTSRVDVDQKVLDKMIWLINERLHIFEKKQKGEKPPYTKDSILSTYRFCNIYRELDRQTIFFHTLLKPLENDFSLWFLNMLFCRSICQTETIKKIGLLSFDEENNKKVFRKLTELPSPKYGNAYIFPISTIQKSKWETREKFFCLYYPTIVKNLIKEIEKFKGLSVVEGLKVLLPILGFNLKFLMTEVLIDVAYQYPQYINLFKQFPIGPGSIPTMKSLSKARDPEVTNWELSKQIYPQINYLTLNGNPVYLSAENWEGIGCELRKYTNLTNGKGRKRLYRV